MAISINSFAACGDPKGWQEQVTGNWSQLIHGGIQGAYVTIPQQKIHISFNGPTQSWLYQTQQTQQTQQSQQQTASCGYMNFGAASSAHYNHSSYRPSNLNHEQVNIVRKLALKYCFFKSFLYMSNIENIFAFDENGNASLMRDNWKADKAMTIIVNDILAETNRLHIDKKEIFADIDFVLDRMPRDQIKQNFMNYYIAELALKKSKNTVVF